VAGGGAGGDAPDAQASALGLPYGQPQPPKRLSPSWDTTNHGGVQREVSGFQLLPGRHLSGGIRGRVFLESAHPGMDPEIEMGRCL